MTPNKPLLPPGKILHGGDYNPDQWLNVPDVIEEDFRLMKLAGCNTFSLGIFAWARYESSEGNFDFDWMERILDRMAEEGHSVFLATPGAARPAWMAFKYEEVRKVDRAGLREHPGGRHNHCWSSPVYREKVAIINRELARRFGAHPAVAAWHISNEYGGVPDPGCYCTGCLDAFHKWLKEKYGSLEALNEAYWSAFWSHTYTDWSQVDPRDTSVDGLAIDWLRFNTWQMVDFYNWEKQALREFSQDLPCTTNFMGLKPDTDFSRFARAVDFVSDDQYPAYDPEATDYADIICLMSFKNDLYRCFKPGVPWILMESCPDAPQWKFPMKLKRPGLHRAEMLQAIGHGADGTCYFQWRKGRGSSEKLHGAVVDHAGHENTRVFKTVASLSALYRKLAPVAGAGTRASIAVIFDWEIMWALAATEGPNLRHEDYQRIILSHYEPYHRNGYTVDVVNSDADLSGYKLVVAPLLFMLKPGLGKRLEAFVQEGGTLVSGYWSGIVGPSNLCFTGGWPGDELRGLFGIWNEETDCLGEGQTRQLKWLDAPKTGQIETVTGSRACAILHAESARVIATYGEDFYAGTPAVTINDLGKGKAVYLGTQLDADSLSQLLISQAGVAGIRPILPDPLPSGVRIQKRTSGSLAFLFIQNFSGEARTVPTGKLQLTNMETDTRVDKAISLAPLESGVWRLENSG